MERTPHLQRFVGLRIWYVADSESLKVEKQLMRATRLGDGKEGGLEQKGGRWQDKLGQVREITKELSQGQEE